MNSKASNSLINETSPYLLQHAENPVHWQPWSEDIFKKAEEENKLIIVSIGYSSCHWCHVMAHESFEDEDVAQIMNEHFICVKVDREEQPDIDHYYMDAVQLMTQRGGWPLNCITLPDGRPIYGGTYFPKERWMNILKTLAEGYKKDEKQFIDYAENLEKGIKESNLVFIKSENDSPEIDLKKAIVKWKQSFDPINGGENGAPKFPLPVNLNFLLQYSHTQQDDDFLRHIKRTLDKMAFGGIYDQIGGGFFRYSTDEKWKVPHFEKMLYDNAQMISLYAKAYQKTQHKLYREIVEQSISFCERELQSENGLFYSALDADSGGTEGGFYIWKSEEIQKIIPQHFDLIKDYYNINEKGLWEENNYILLRGINDEDFAQEKNLDLSKWQEIKKETKEQLLTARNKRASPGLDNKSITSWNAMMAQAYVDAGLALNDSDYLEKAKGLMQAIFRNISDENDLLNHIYTKGKAKIKGFLEDYAWCISACISIYETNFESEWLKKAQALSTYTKKHFFSSKHQTFFFSEKGQNDRLNRKIETIDNVIPSSNSIMAINLLKLGHFFDDEEDRKMAQTMLKNVSATIEAYPNNLANWASLYLLIKNGLNEIAIVGKEYKEKQSDFQQHYIPNAIFCGSEKESNFLPLLKDKYVKDKTLIYVCRDKTCQAPVEYVNETLQQLID